MMCSLSGPYESVLGPIHTIDRLRPVPACITFSAVQCQLLSVLCDVLDAS